MNMSIEKVLSCGCHNKDQQSEGAFAKSKTVAIPVPAFEPSRVPHNNTRHTHNAYTKATEYTQVEVEEEEK